MTYDISIIIVNYNTKKLLKNCLESIFKYTKQVNHEVIVVDNASSDDSIKMVNKDYPKVKLIKNKDNLGFAKANNLGIRESKGKYIVLLNSDTELKSNIFKNMYEWMENNKSIGVSTCKLIYPDGRVQSAGGYLPNLLRVASWMLFQDIPFVDRLIKPFQPHKELSPMKNDEIYKKSNNLEWLAGTCFIIRRKVIDDVGYLDEDYFMYTEDVDYCYRVNEFGWDIGYNPKYELIHHKGASGSSEFSVRQEFKGIKIFFKKHYPAWQYPILRLILKAGALERMILFRLIGSTDRVKIYEKTLKTI
ncbi:glycosyltransferase family 2 protein [Candidatus Woesebacteria bacterium]|nr:glycosyltransferase family 2 protein [Candidatus Woesebacteria bacterium]